MTKERITLMTHMVYEKDLIEFLRTLPEFDVISNLSVLEKGMTNKSFTFESNQKKYILRIPGKGTDKLINRKYENAVYQEIKGKNLCDNILYFNPISGYKITEFIAGAHTCDPKNTEDIQKCFRKLKELHGMNLKVPHSFDIIEKMLFYESLMDGTTSEYENYTQVKQRVLRLKSFVDRLEKNFCLTHMDAVCDNFLITNTDVTLIDWEYAAMQDPHVDIAMFIIYSMLSREQADQVINIYFENTCPFDTQLKIYSYIAMCGLLWSNWCEYKKKLGIDFGEYAKAQFSFADQYSTFVLSNI